MSGWLTKEWVDHVATTISERPPAPGVNGVVAVVITGGPDGEVTLPVRYDDGKPSWAPPPGPADVTFTVPAAEARAILDGGEEPSVGFMRGRIKTAGDPGAVLAWLQSTATPAWQAWRAGIQAATED